MNPSRLPGLLLLAAALLCHRWALERVLVADQEVHRAALHWVLWGVQGITAAAGLIVLLRPSLLRRSLRWWVSLAACAALVVGLVGNVEVLRGERQRQEKSLLAVLDRSEELYLELSKVFKKTLNRSAGNLLLADHYSEALFADSVEIRDLAAEPPERATAAAHPLFERWKYRLQQPTTATKIDGSLPPIWCALLEELDYFEWAKFFIHLGRFRDHSEQHYDCTLRFAGRARDRAGMLRQLAGEVDCSFERGEPGAAGAWRICRFVTHKLTSWQTQDRLFADVAAEAVHPARARREVLGSRHEDLVRRFFLDEDFEKPGPYFTLQSFDRHPGISVVDLNGDGADDVYVLQRWGANLLLMNRGDGTFVEAAAEWGLDLPGNSSAAVFADLDNDGDQDLLLGRTLKPSLYLVQEGGQFVDRSKDRIEGELPSLVSSISAADFDQDGLLDLYVATYAANMMDQEYRTFHQAREPHMLQEFLPAAESAELYRRTAKEWHKYKNKLGPPNVLLRNLGGGCLEKVDVPEVAVWKNTLQATWSDVDGDGDPDLYCANDFSTNNLLRNEGQGHFVDVTETSRTADIGFGMGASFGDYDNDGDQDLYVANMFSKAGERIMKQIPRLDPRFAAMARGNSLFRNDGSAFTKVSGRAPRDLQVELGGWSWGGQFWDADNDGFLDIYTLSGYYTAPAEVAIAVDT
jgi:hypothetical protein